MAEYNPNKERMIVGDILVVEERILEIILTYADPCWLLLIGLNLGLGAMYEDGWLSKYNFSFGMNEHEHSFKFS